MSPRHRVLHLVSHALLLATIATSGASAQNLLTDPGFETGLVPTCNPGNWPLDTWEWVDFSPDVISTDCSTLTGAEPSSLFADGIGAHGGLRFAGAAYLGFNQELFGQTLDAPLVEGTTYELTGYFAIGNDPDFTTARYDVYTTDDFDTGTRTLVGSIGNNAVPSLWTFDSLVFTAPAGASIILFKTEQNDTATPVTYLLCDDLGLGLPAVPTESATWGEVKGRF